MPRRPTAVRRAQLVDAAARILATQGARRLTAEQLASVVGVTPGAIFRHFSSMDAIVDGVVERMEARLEADYPPRLPDPLERLRVFFHRRIRTVRADPHTSRLLLSDHLAQAGGRAQSARVEAFKARSWAFVLASLREAARRGRLRPGVRPEAGAVLVTGAILALAHTSARPAGRRRLGRLAAGVWTAIEAVLAGAPPPAGRHPAAGPHDHR